MPAESWTPSEDEITVARISTNILIEEVGLDPEDPKVKKLIERLISTRAHLIAEARFYSTALNRMTFAKDETNTD